MGGSFRITVGHRRITVSDFCRATVAMVDGYDRAGMLCS